MHEVINRKEYELEKLNQEVVKKVPHEEYDTASTRRKRFTALGVIFLLVVELTIAGLFSYEILPFGFSLHTLDVGHARLFGGELPFIGTDHGLDLIGTLGGEEELSYARRAEVVFIRAPDGVGI